MKKVILGLMVGLVMSLSANTKMKKDEVIDLDKQILVKSIDKKITEEKRKNIYSAYVIINNGYTKKEQISMLDKAKNDVIKNKTYSSKSKEIIKAYEEYKYITNKYKNEMSDETIAYILSK